MRILMTGEMPPTPTGIAFHVHYMARALRRLGHDVGVVNVSHYPSEDADWNMAPLGSGAGAIAPLAKASLAPVPLRVRAQLAREAARGRAFASTLYYVPRFHRIAREFRPDVLHTHSVGWSYSTMTLARLLDKPVVATAHGHETITSVHQADIGAMARATLKDADAVIAVSSELQELAADVRGGDVRYVPNGVETDRFTPDAEPSFRAEWAPNGEKVILCPKKWGVKFGYEILARALPHVVKEQPDVRLVLTGDPKLDPTLHERVGRILEKEGLKDRLVVPGMLPGDRMPEVLASADVVAFPSFAEAVCLACLEAMAVARPLVTTPVGGFPEIVEEGVNGYMVDLTGSRKSTYTWGYDVPEARVKEFADRLVELLSDDEKRRRFGAAARRTAERYSWLSQAEKTLDVYRSVGVA